MLVGPNVSIPPSYAVSFSPHWSALLFALVSPLPLRIAFVLYFVDGRPIDEVAAITGGNVVLTKGRIFHARRTLLARAKKDPVLKDLLVEREKP